MVQIEQVYVPSGRMVEVYGSVEEATKHRQDAAVIWQDENSCTFAVIDGARNFIGRTAYPFPIIAEERGLAPETELNGGEIVASAFAALVRCVPDRTGYHLIRLLNDELATVYRRLGIEVDLTKRGELFTGYIAHVRVTEDAITITGVGDCYVAINGELVVGSEKEVDIFNDEIVCKVAAFYGRDRQWAYQGIMPFVNAAQFDLQNDPSKPNWYPAIDGTKTPEQGVTVVTYPRPRSGIDQIMLWTDGFTVGANYLGSLDSLVPTNLPFGERTAIRVTGLRESSP